MRRPNLLRPLTRAALLLASGAGLAGCATERDPISRVQANALSKEFFVGSLSTPDDDPEFFTRSFVVDGSEAQELVGIGSYSGLERIRWEVTEKLLLARRAYPEGEGATDRGNAGPPDGTILAAYPIESHFDVRRSYNPQTGEELNVVEENTTDRPWQERSHFRVDWSMNQVESANWTDLFIGRLTGEIEITPLAYAVTDPDAEDAPHFDRKDGYLDVTSKFLVAPAASMYPGLPQCVLMGFVTGTAVSNCDPQEAVIRTSYLRVDTVDPDGDFEPFENTRAPQDIFGNPGGQGDSLTAGFLTPPRMEWDPGYGYTDAKLRRYMNLHDVWEQAHQTRGRCDSDAACGRITGRAGSVCLPSGTCTLPCSYGARRDDDRNGTDDQCENASTGYGGEQGAQCSARDRCTLPVRDRKLRAIPWWVNRETPAALQDETNGSGEPVKEGPTEQIVATWSQAIAHSIAAAREVECRRTGGDRVSCHEAYFVPGEIDMVRSGGWGIPRVRDRAPAVVLCHNPVRDYDPEVCGAPGDVARVGDVRKNFLFYWPHASQAPWGGIANWVGDPLTGQMVGAAATTMGRSAAQAAAMVRDVLLTANGELDLDDITLGVPAYRFEQALRQGQRREALPRARVDELSAQIDRAGARAAFRLDAGSPLVADRRAQAALLKASTVVDGPGIAVAHAAVDASLARLRGSPLEARLVDGAGLGDALGLSPSTALTAEVIAAASPFGGRDSARLDRFASGLLGRLADRGVCVFAPGDAAGNPDLHGLARYFYDPADPTRGLYRDEEVQRRYPDAADPASLRDRRAKLIFDHLWKETYKGIALHEIGHALGMFHNFASSYDALNYVPQYWQLRTAEGEATADCGGEARTGTEDSCMGPRFFDPETDDELGQADEPRPGIVYFGHTSTMEYQNERFFETIGLGPYDLMTMGALYGRVLETFDADAPGGVPLDEQSAFSTLSLSQLIEDNLLGLQSVHYTELARAARLFDPARCRDATPEEKATAEWRLVHGKVCLGAPRDHAAWGDFVDGAAAGITVTRAQASPDAPGGTGAYRRPYRFGQTNNAYIHINPFDSGADPFEVTREAIRKFEYSYPFQYFRRARRDWNSEALPSITASRFFERLRSYHWVLARNNALDDVVDIPRDDVGRSQVLAELDGLNALIRAMTVPQIGGFERNGSAQPGRTLFDVSPGRDGAFTLDASNARFVDPDYDSSSQAGGSWNYGEYLVHAGFHVEKADAARALTDGRPTLQTITRETYLDGRELNVTFYTDLSLALDRVLGGVLSGDFAAVAPFVRDAGQPVVEYPEFTAATPPVTPVGAYPLFPNLGYKQQVGALIWAEVFSRLGADLTLANKLRVHVEGTEGVVEFPEAEQVKFTDPRSGITYVARRYPFAATGEERGIAARMVARGNALVELAYETQKDAVTGEPLRDSFGRPLLAPGAVDAAAASGLARQALADHVGLLDTAVQVAVLLGHGPL